MIFVFLLKTNPAPFAGNGLSWYFGVNSNVDLRVAEFIVSSDTPDNVFVHLNHSYSRDIIQSVRFVGFLVDLLNLPQIMGESNCFLESISR